MTPRPLPVRAARGSAKAIGALALALLVALAPGGAESQSRAPAARVGILSFFPPPSALNPDPTEPVVRQTLRELGYVEGENIVIERRFASGQPERLAAMADELVRLKVDVILAGGQPPREAARKATTTIPIVTISGSDPVREGWAKSLAHPGGNVTGITFTYPELGPKRIELLKEALPSLKRVAVIIDPIEVVDFVEVLREIETGALRLGLQLQVLKVAGPDGLPAAFAAVRQGGAQALHPVAMWPHRVRVAALAAKAALPTMGESSEEVQEGYLLSYGADLNDLVRRSLLQMDKVLKGARPADLPIERPTKFRLSINLKTAKALGITIPQALLLRADEVIQ
jgi:putative ABC transport system substrate-binding protein